MVGCRSDDYAWMQLEWRQHSLVLDHAIALVLPTAVILCQFCASFSNFLDAFDASYCEGDDPVQHGVYYHLH